MQLSIFTDELGCDITKALPILQDWGLQTIDLRGRCFGKAFEDLDDEELKRLKELIDRHGMAVGCLCSSLAKVHLPDRERQEAEQQKLERIIRAAEVLGCRLVRSFFYWQPKAAGHPELAGVLATPPDLQQKVADHFRPLADRAHEAGLVLAFENCGVTPWEVFAILDTLDVPTWGLAWDPHNDWSSPERKQDEAAYIERMARRTRQLHVKAAGAVEGLKPWTIPYDKVLAILEAVGFDGPVSIETHNPDRTASAEEMSKRTVAVIRRAWPAAAPGGVDAEPARYAGIQRDWQDRPVAFGVIGLGMGHNRSRQIAETPGNRLAVVCDKDKSRAQRTAEAFDVPSTLDYRELLERDDVEVVYVNTETGNRVEIVEDCFAAGKHVLATKPMEINVERCDRMIEAADRAGRLLGVEFDMRYRDETWQVKRAIEEGRFGELTTANAQLKIYRGPDYFASNDGWRGTWRWDGGGVLSNQAIHLIDFLAFTCGLPEKVRCNIWTQTHDIEAEDHGSAQWLYAGGLVVTFTATTSYPHKTWYTHLEIEGARGAYSHHAGGPFDKPMVRWFYDNVWTDRPPIAATSPWVNGTDNFAAALRQGADLLADGRDGRATQSILDAMYRSAREEDGRWIDLGVLQPAGR